MNLAQNTNKCPSMALANRIDMITALATEGRDYLDKAVGLFAYLDGENGNEDGYSAELDVEMRRELNRCVAAVAGALRCVIDEAKELEKACTVEQAEPLELIDAAAEE